MSFFGGVEAAVEIRQIFEVRSHICRTLVDTLMQLLFLQLKKRILLYVMSRRSFYLCSKIKKNNTLSTMTKSTLSTTKAAPAAKKKASK